MPTTIDPERERVLHQTRHFRTVDTASGTMLQLKGETSTHLGSTRIPPEQAVMLTELAERAFTMGARAQMKKFARDVHDWANKEYQDLCGSSCHPEGGRRARRS